MLTSAVLLFVLMAAGAVAPEGCLFPNELSGFKLCANSPWRVLRPLVSSAADVRRVLGAPTEELDIGHYGDPYAGDSKAVAPVLTFDGRPDWEIVVYFVRSDSHARESLSESVRDRLLSIDLVPKRRRSFAGVALPQSFRKRHVIAADAAWDEYADGSGLAYLVYTSRTPYGDEQPGDLSRIVYGASDQLKGKYGRR
jgi:hypothetical protein